MARNNCMLTEINSKGFAVLKNPLHLDRAISKLNDYESLGLTAAEIREKLIRIENLEKRIKQLEGW